MYRIWTVVDFNSVVHLYSEEIGREMILFQENLGVSK